ncbi:bifunctional 2',3'-cyclic-nucleotide 2'-phosphodiesterase/3'-nucleotidase [Massilia sp. UMI-21]|nr:bifunctional 2',3'-cyclic-nucleotide 2'-phosphodiesterase/3'-nucleotidase [Massilia sp. UMI-21]
MAIHLRYQICIALAPALFTAPSFAAKPPAAGTTALLAVLETTDLHSNLVGYDYYKLAPEPSHGLDRTATLIRQARQEFPNTLLLDNGDTIQGTALADYQAQVRRVDCGQTLGIYKIMNRLRYDGAGIGNHEFNYGLDYLGQVTGSRFRGAGTEQPKRCAGPAFPMVLANVYSARTKQPLFSPYAIIDKQVEARDATGKAVKATVRVGIIGFTPPTIMEWDKRWLEGRVFTTGVVEAAQKYVPEMKRKGADLVIAISHGGLDGAPYSPAMENANWHLAKVAGIDAMLLGHAHQLFPSADSSAPQFNLPGVDKARGLVHGVPTVMANLWGKHLGVVQLHLKHDGKRWTVEQDKTRVEARAAQTGAKSYVDADPGVMALVKEEHEATIRYVKTPVGATEFRMSSYFADVGDISALQLVNQAQTAYVRRFVAANLPQYKDLPVLSVTAPFKSGIAGPADYTDVKAGDLALNNAADLYLYPNALYAVKVNGAELKAWLEKAAQRFNTIDPAKTEPQQLVNLAVASYNFDTVTSPEVSYQIDLTRAPGERVSKLSWRGQPVLPAQEFLVATNNYRASGGGHFPGLDGSKTVIASPDNNREVMIGYIRDARRLTRAANASARSWRFAPVKTAGPVVFSSAPGMIDLAHEAGLHNVRQLAPDDGRGKGMALYAIDLSQ